MMMMKSVLCVVAFFVVGSSSGAELDCTLSSPIPFGGQGGGLGLRQRMNLVEKTATIQFIYEGQGWLGIGRSSRDGWMTGGEAVIGLPDEPNGSTNPGKYSMFTEDEDGSGVVLMEAQTLQDASIFQNETHTVLTYTKLLEEAGELSIPEDEKANWIWAVGADNTYPSVHEMDGSFNIELWPCSVIEEKEVEQEPDDTSDAEGGEQKQEEEETAGNTTETSDKNVGTKGRDTPPDFGLVEVASEESTNRQLWLAHGYLLAISWGLFVPLAIGASILRNVIPCWFLLHRILNGLALLFTIIGFCIAVAAMEDEGGQHFKENKHTKAGLAVFILVVLQAVFGVIRPSTTNKGQVEMDDNNQNKSESKDQEEEEEEEEEMEAEQEDEADFKEQAKYKHAKDDELEVTSGDDGNFEKEQDETMELNSEDGSEEDQHTKVEDKTEEDSGEKSLTRRLWEYTHRTVGIAVVGLAWYSCHSGIEEYEGKYGEDDNATTAFWAVTGTISGIIFFCSYVVRL